ncbi:hypothetical protein D3C76_720700 [compost metagenome]
MTLGRLLDILVPRFITEDVALINAYCDDCDHPHLMPVCCLADVDPDEEFDAIGTMSCFNLFGWALFAKLVGDVRPWVNPHDGVRS